MNCRFISTVTVFIITLASWLVPTYALAFVQVDGIYYNLNTSDKTAIVTNSGTTGSYAGDVVIPDRFDYEGSTYLVTNIGSSAFEFCPGLTSVLIPNSITSIGLNAFSYCYDLTTLTIPNSVISIKEHAFGYCYNLTYVSIGNSVKNIGKLAFTNCSSLSSVTLPNSVTTIGESSFNGCTSLTSVVIPSSVTTFGDHVFSGCTRLASISVEANNSIFDSRGNCNAIIKTSSNMLIIGCMNTIIPNSVTSIGDYAFSGCSTLTSLAIPNSVTSIGKYAFSGCSGLISITIPNGVINLGNNAFWSCTDMTSITISNSVETIGNYTFSCCSSLTSITIPSSVTAIGSEAFSNCSSLESITVEREIPLSISNGTFNNVDKTSCTLYVPVGSKSAYENAEGWGEFQNIVEYTPGPEVLATGSCGDNVTYTIYPDQSMVITGSGPMWDFTIIEDDETGTASLNRENNEYWTQVRTVTIEEGVTTIGDFAFSECSELTSVSIPNSVTSIGSSAFFGCSALTSITIPASVATIGENALSYSGLTHIYIEDSDDELQFEQVTFYMEDYVDPLEYVYLGRNIRTIDFWEGNPWQGVGGYPPFSNSSNIHTLEIGNKVTYLEDWSFAEAPLQSLVIGSNVQSIGTRALSSANMSQNLVIPSSVKRMGNYSLSPSISTLVLENGDDDLEIFAGYNSLELSFYGSESSIDSIYVGRNLTCSSNNIHVVCRSAFIDASLRAQAKTIEHDEDGGIIVLEYYESPINATNLYFGSGASIGEYYFQNSPVEHIYNLNPSQTGYYAFFNCKNLQTIGFDVNGSVSIRAGAFAGCSNLKTLVIPEEVTSIGSCAFYNCGIENVYVGPTPALIDESTFGIDDSGYEEEDENYIPISRTLYVPIGCKTVYENAEGWSEFGNVVEYFDNSDLDVLARGSCGDNVTYTIYSDMTMVISGTGEIKNYFGGAHINNEYYQSIEKVIIEGGVTSIGSYAFRDCVGLTSLTISNSVAFIKEGAFRGCTSLASVTIPSSVTSIEYSDDNPFYGCCGLTSIIVETGNLSFDSRDNCNAIIKTSTNELIAGCVNTVIPEGVTRIGRGAFSGLVSLDIPSSVISISSSAFENSSNLSTITVDAENAIYDSRDNCDAIIETSTNTLVLGCKNTVIPSTVTTIGSHAFEKCTGLTSIDIPNSVSAINSQAFYGCSGLNSVTIGACVTFIGPSAFGRCTGLTSITVKGQTPATIESAPEYDTFEGIDMTSCILYVPFGSKSAYENATYWKEFENIVEFGEEPDTDISALDNAIYVEQTEGRIGGTKDISVRMKSDYDVCAFQFTMTVPEGVTIKSWTISNKRLPSGASISPQGNISEDASTVNIACSLSRDYFTGRDGEIVTVRVEIGEDMEEGSYPIYLTNCHSNDFSTIDHPMSDVKASLVLEDYVVGDANGDGQVLVGDVTALLNYIVGRPISNFQEKAADVNGDGVILVGDVTGLLNIIVNQ